MNEVMKNESADTDTNLKALRESRGLTLDDIFNATRIRLAFIEAIESGEFNLLPERIYAEAFIKGYAAQLGIDPEIILSQYRKLLSPPEPPRENAPKKQTTPLPPKEAPVQKPFRKEEAKQQSAAGRKPALSRMAVALILSAIVISVGFLYFLFSDDDSTAPLQVNSRPVIPQVQPQAAPPEEKPSQGSSAVGQAGANPQQTDAAPNATQSIKQDAKPGTNPAESVNPTVNKIAIQAGELTWLSITEDENPAYQIMMRPGDSIEREAGKFQLDIGNAGGISISLNGTYLGSQGRSGQVVHLVLPREQDSGNSRQTER